MTKTNKTQEERHRCWKFDHCPYCGSDSVILTSTKKGYNAKCLKCNAENNFTNERVKEWAGGLV